MIMTAQMIDAQTALQYGLVNHVTAQPELLQKAEEIAQKIARNCPSAIKLAIAAVNANCEDGVNGFETEMKNFGISFGTRDSKEGTTACLGRRKREATR